MLDRLNVKAFKMRFVVNEEKEFRYENGLLTSTRELPVEDPLIDLLRKNPCINGKDFEIAASKLGISRDKARRFLRDNADHLVRANRWSKKLETLCSLRSD